MLLELSFFFSSWNRGTCRKWGNTVIWRFNCAPSFFFLSRVAWNAWRILCVLICSISLLQCAHRAVLCSVLTIVFGFKCLTVFVVVVPATCLPSIHCFPLSIITASNAEILTIKLCLTKLESIHKEGSSISVSPQLTRGSLKWVSCQYLGPAMSTCMAVPESSQACQTPMKTSTMAR